MTLKSGKVVFQTYIFFKKEQFFVFSGKTTLTVAKQWFPENFQSGI